MIQKLVHFSLHNRFLVLILTVAGIAAGSYALLHTPIDAFPDTTPVQVQINTSAPSLNPEEIEQQITLPIELALGGLPGLTNVRSISKFGLSQVVATFSDETSIVDARQYVSERLYTVELADDFARPELGPIATGLGEVFHYILYSPKGTKSLTDLRTLHDWVVRPELRKVSGVAEVNSWGGFKKEFHVIVAPELLLKYELTLDDVFSALARNNENVGGGMITSGGQSRLVHGLGRVSSSREIGAIVISSFDGVPVHIRDIASDVKVDHELRRGAVTANGRGEVVLGLAFMLMGENGKAVTERLKESLTRVQQALPEDVAVDVVYDRTELTTEVINTVKHNLAAGGSLVVVVLFVLLGNLRAGLLVAITIPLAMLFAAVGMYHFAIAASLLSLGAIDFGIIVDGSVVMTEANLRAISEKTRQLKRTLSRNERLETLLQSASEVATPIVYGMIIITVVFFPVLALEGIEGKMFRPMALTFIFALAGALLIALTLTPVLNYFFLPERIVEEESRLIRWLNGNYERCLALAIRFRHYVVSGAVVLLLLAAWGASKLGGEFLPRLSEGAIVLNTIRLAGVSVDEAARYNTEIEKLLLERFPNEIRHVWSRIGTAEVATDPMGIELTDVFISLNAREMWIEAASQSELVAEMQEALDDLPGVNIVATQPIEMRLNEMASGIRSDLGIKIYGDDFEQLVVLSDAVQEVLTGIKGRSDVAGDQLTGQPTVQIKIDTEAVARFGLSSREVLNFVESVGGRSVGSVYVGQRKFPLVVRLSDQHREDIDVLRETLIPTESGLRVPLGSVATIVEKEGISTIARDWGKRLIRVQANIAGRDVSSFVTEAQAAIAEKVTLPDGYLIEWGGQFENLVQAKRRFMLVVPITLLLVFGLLFFSLRHLRDVLLVYSGIPFAAVGGVFGLWLRGIPFSVSAAIGFIALSGIAVLNGQILVTAIRSRIAQGMMVDRAVRMAASDRLRPVLATAITDAVGFIPMAISSGVGAEVQRPLATVVIAGVSTSTLLTLFVLPLLYLFTAETASVGEQTP